MSVESSLRLGRKVRHNPGPANLDLVVSRVGRGEIGPNDMALHGNRLGGHLVGRLVGRRVGGRVRRGLWVLMVLLGCLGVLGRLGVCSWVNLHTLEDSFWMGNIEDRVDERLLEGLETRRKGWETRREGRLELGCLGYPIGA